jgi:hypothetical protein
MEKIQRLYGLRPGLALIAIPAGLFLLATPAWAWQKQTPEDALLSVNNNLGLFLVPDQNVNYVEPNGSLTACTGGGSCANYSDEESGGLFGDGFSMDYMSREMKLYAHLSYRLETGHLGYNGQTQTGTPVQGTSGARIGDWDFKLGKGFMLSKDQRVLLTPYLEFGTHFWQRDVGLGTASQFGEDYQNDYWDAGTMIQYAPPLHVLHQNDLVFSGNAGMGETLGPNISVPSANPPMPNAAALGQEPILHAGLEADWHAMSALWAFFGYEYTYFSYFPSSIYSNAAGAVEEPASFTNYNAYKIGVKIPFSGFALMAHEIARIVDSKN